MHPVPRSIDCDRFRENMASRKSKVFARFYVEILLDDRLKLDTKILLSIFVLLLLTFRSSLEQIEQVTRGHNIVADGWAGASNPNQHPMPPHQHTYPKQNIQIACFCTFQLVRYRQTDRRTDGQSLL